MEFSPCLEDCLNLLRGERDEQKLAGLLLATKLSKGDDHAAILSIYKAVGTRFLHRLLITGAGSVRGGTDKVEYLKLSVTLLAGFCRVPEIASSQEMISEIPIITEIISNSSDPSISEECYEFFLLVSSAFENAITQIIESGSIQPLARHISFLHKGSRSLEHAVKLLQLISNMIPSETLDKRYLSGMAWMVASLSRQFAVLHNALKFDVMHMLTTFLSSRNVLFHEALRELLRENWATYVYVGIMEILQNRIVSCEKLQALLLLDSIMYIIGESWLLEEKTVLDAQETLPVDNYLAEAPFACKEKMRDLLQYLLSVEGEDEPSPFYSICFLLPMLCQTTMEIDGCKVLASFGGHKSVVECLVKLLGKNGASDENTGTIYLACDIILNLLLSRKELGNQIEGSQFLILLQELCVWAEKSRNDPSVVMMASSICALVLDLTSEKNLLNHAALERLSQLIIRSLSLGLLKDESNSNHDLHEIVRAGYDRWAHRYPFVQNVVERAMKA